MGDTIQPVNTTKTESVQPEDFKLSEDMSTAEKLRLASLQCEDYPEVPILFPTKKADKVVVEEKDCMEVMSELCAIDPEQEFKNGFLMRISVPNGRIQVNDCKEMNAEFDRQAEERAYIRELMKAE